MLCYDVVRALKSLGEEGLDLLLMWLRVRIDRAYRADESELRSEKNYGDAYKYLIIIYSELSNILFDLVKGKNIEVRYQFNLRNVVFALSHVCVAVILLRFASDPQLIQDNERFYDREEHK